MAVVVVQYINVV